MTYSTQTRSDITKAIDLLDTRRHEVAQGEHMDGADGAGVETELKTLDTAIANLRGLL